MTHNAPEKGISYEDIGKWFMGIMASVLLISIGWVLTINNHVSALEVRVGNLEIQMAKMLTKDEHIVFYNQVLRDLDDVKMEQSRQREILMRHENESLTHRNK